MESFSANNNKFIKNKIYFFIATTLCIMTIVTSVAIGYTISKNKYKEYNDTLTLQYNEKISELENEIAILCTKEEELTTALIEKTEECETLNQSLTNAIDDIKVMETQYGELYTEYEDFQETVGYTKLSLYEIGNKYRYIIDEVPEGSKLSLENLMLIDELASKYDINPHIVTSVFRIESGYDSNAKNPISSARGLGQFLESSGEYVYEDVLKMGDNYYHSVHAYDPAISITMTFGYLNHLMTTYDKSIWSALNNYSGGAPSYVQLVKNITSNRTRTADIDTGYQ